MTIESELHNDAISSVGTLKMIPKDAVTELWRAVSVILSSYRGAWSLDDVRVRAQAAVAIRPRLPRTGWLTRALALEKGRSVDVGRSVPSVFGAPTGVDA